MKIDFILPSINIFADITAEIVAGDTVGTLPSADFENSLSQKVYSKHMHKNTLHSSSFHFYPFFILHNITTQYMLSFSVQKFSRSLWPTQAKVNQRHPKAHEFFCYVFLYSSL